ncbi:5'-3' exoribonuclease 2 [Bienertia sinuspersici]
MKQSGKGTKAHTKVAQAHESKDRKSGSGVNGLPKKGGHGGKFTWAGDGLLADHEIATSAVDVKDPNFEDPADDEVVVLNT